MPVPTAPHYRLALTQSLGDGETMVTTVKMAVGTTAPQAPVGGTADEVATATLPAFNAWTLSRKSQRITQWLPTLYSVYLIGGDGLAVEQAERAPAANVGTNSGAAMPLETAMVLTLQTGGPGARRRGRTYLGGFPTSVMGTLAAEKGKFVAASVLNEVTAFAQLLTDLDAALGAGSNNPLDAVIVSNASVPPSAYSITTVRGGNVPDVQRRRNTSSVETYQSVTVSNS